MRSEDGRDSGGSTSSKAEQRMTRFWNGGVDSLAAFGSAMIVFLMGIIVADVVARNTIGASLPLIAELGALTVVLIVFLQLGTAVRNDRLASTDFFLQAVAARQPRLAAGFRAVWDLAGAAVCAGIAWSSWGILQRDLEHREFIGVTGVLTMPTSPFRALIFLGATIAAIQFVLMAVSRLHRATIAGDRQP
jgi:TRAP-type C4-dicarboxylate transport system permease small subunit